MRPSRFTEEQHHRDAEGTRARAKTADVCRKQGISAATFYNFKAKFGGQMLDNAIPNHVAAKKW